MAHRIFRTHAAIFVEPADEPGLFRQLSSAFSFDALFCAEDPVAWFEEVLADASEAESFNPEIPCSAPIGSQEVWAAGVTYYRSRTARMEEAQSAGGDVFYDKVYDAERPELFFKATAGRTRGHLDRVAIRSDSSWDVPEPEFTLAISASGKLFGYTVGNDMSSRSIEGENPLYLPQAKVYAGSCAIGPCLVVGALPGPETAIRIEITRNDAIVFQGESEASQIKRGFEELAEFLYRCNEFPKGAYLMTGTGIVPDSDFTLEPGDLVAITVDGVGTLVNEVERL